MAFPRKNKRENQTKLKKRSGSEEWKKSCLLDRRRQWQERGRAWGLEFLCLRREELIISKETGVHANLLTFQSPKEVAGLQGSSWVCLGQRVKEVSGPRQNLQSRKMHFLYKHCGLISYNLYLVNSLGSDFMSYLTKWAWSPPMSWGSLWILLLPLPTGLAKSSWEILCMAPYWSSVQMGGKNTWVLKGLRQMALLCLCAE